MCIIINTPKGHTCCVAWHVGGQWIAHQWHNVTVGTKIAIPSYSIQDGYEVQKIMYHSIKNCLVNNKAWTLMTKNHRHHHWLITAKVQKKIWKLSPVVLCGTKLIFHSHKIIYSSATLDKYAIKFNYSEITGISLYEYKTKIYNEDLLAS